MIRSWSRLVTSSRAPSDGSAMRRLGRVPLGAGSPAYRRGRTGSRTARPASARSRRLRVQRGLDVVLARTSTRPAAGTSRSTQQDATCRQVSPAASTRALNPSDSRDRRPHRRERRPGTAPRASRSSPRPTPRRRRSAARSRRRTTRPRRCGVDLVGPLVDDLDAHVRESIGRTSGQRQRRAEPEELEPALVRGAASGGW